MTASPLTTLQGLLLGWIADHPEATPDDAAVALGLDDETTLGLYRTSASVFPPHPRLAAARAVTWRGRAARPRRRRRLRQSAPAVVGARGHNRATARHGVSRIQRGERLALGIIFHDAE